MTWENDYLNHLAKLITGSEEVDSEALINELRSQDQSDKTDHIDENEPGVKAFPVHVTIKKNSSMPGIYSILVETITPPGVAGASIYRGSGYGWGPEVVDAEFKDWKLVIRAPWELENLFKSEPLAFKWRKHPTVPDLLFCDVTFGKVPVVTVQGKADGPDAEALPGTGGKMFWWKTFPYPPFYHPIL